MSIRKRVWTNKGETKEAWVHDYKDQAGRRRHKQFDHKKDADAYRRKVEDEIERGIHTPARLTTSFAKACQAWLDRCEARWKEKNSRDDGITFGTLVQYQRLARVHVLPALGGMKLNEIDSSHVARFLEQKMREQRPDGRRGYMRKYIEHMKIVISETLQHAVAEKWLVRNVLRDNPVSTPGTRPRRRVPTEAQVQRLFDVLSYGPQFRDQRYAFFNTAMIVVLSSLAMRRGEIVGLQWEDVNFEHGLIHLTHTQTEHEGLKETPKTKSGIRPIHMPETVRDQLWQHLQRQGGPRTGYVLRNREGKPMRLGKVSADMWHALMRRAGLVDAANQPLFNFHGMRHGAAQYMKNRGVPLTDLSRHMGHARESTTADMYGYNRRIGVEAQVLDAKMAQLGMQRLLAIGGPAAPILVSPEREAPTPAEPWSPPATMTYQYDGVVSEKPRSVNATMARILELHGRGVRKPEIAQQVGVSLPTVYEWLGQAGLITPRPDPELQREQALEMYRQGATTKQITRQCQIGYPRLVEWIVAAGMPRPTRRDLGEQKAKVLELYGQGLPLVEIQARVPDVCLQTIYDWLNKSGQPLRHPTCGRPRCSKDATRPS